MAVLSLQKLSEKSIDYILTRSVEERQKYFTNLIESFYPTVKLESEQYYELLVAYECSFALEKLYRNNKHLKEGFMPIYTKTGLIRELTNFVYFDDSNLITH